MVGKAVAEAIHSGLPLDQLDFPAIDPGFPTDSNAVFSLDRALSSRTNPGSPSISNVIAEIQRWRSKCNDVKT